MRQQRSCLALFAGLSVVATAGSHSESQWKIVPIAGDGKCLFRSVAQVASVRSQGKLLAAKEETGAADDLRANAVAELARRRDETEWFIEGNFDQYLKKMASPHTWGGEPEIVMLTHVLKTPISVCMTVPQEGLRSIADYGQEYAEQTDSEDTCEDNNAEVAEPLRIFFHGAGHYEAIVTEPLQQSRL